MRRLTIAFIALAAWAGAAASADAHIQVRPTTAAPGDAVQFDLLVPNERSQSTVAVSLQIPKDVLPFSFEDPPGWRRTNELAGDGSIKVVRWRGRLRKDGFAEFRFLASTPEREGPIAWKSIQTYEDGKETAWIGPPDSDEPAAITNLTAAVPRQNAGGEGEGAASAGDAGSESASAGDSSSSSDDNRDWLAVALGAGGLVLGAAALAVALRRRRVTPSA